MALSECNKHQDVVALIPTFHMDEQKLKAATWYVLKILFEAGFNVVSLCYDNYSANRSFFKNILCGGVLSSMVYNPITKKPLFLLFDSVHNVKNIYNNFCKRKELSFPDILLTLPPSKLLHLMTSDTYMLNNQNAILSSHTS